jgi:cell division protein FtsQ
MKANAALIKQVIGMVILFTLVLSAVVFAEISFNEVVCKGVEITLDSENEKALLSKKDIKLMVSEQGTEYFLDKPISQISLRKIEERIKRIPLVKSCEAHHDFSGVISVSVKEYKPIARIVRSTVGTSPYPDQYISEDGKFIGTSPLFTPRIIVTGGAYFDGKRDLQDKRGKTLIPFFQFIENNEFWKAQISQIIVAKDGGIVLIPTIGTTRIDFGLPINIENKFKKLFIFYQKVIPNKGWNKYRWVQLKYKNQLICE